MIDDILRTLLYYSDEFKSSSSNAENIGRNHNKDQAFLRKRKHRINVKSSTASNDIAPVRVIFRTVLTVIMLLAKVFMIFAKRLLRKLWRPIRNMIISSEHEEVFKLPVNSRGLKMKYGLGVHNTTMYCGIDFPRKNRC